MSGRGPALVVAATVLVAAAVTLPFLGHPSGIVFDETYYVTDARAILEGGVEDGFAVHPPLGKWLIAGGIAVVGDTEVGWRLPGALLAILASGLVALLGCWLARRWWAGLLAGGLVALDGVWLVQARTAMLDAPMAAGVVVGATLLVLDRRRASAAAGAERSWRHRWPLFASGIAFGLAIATKWSGALALVAAVLLVGGWELAALRRRGTLDRRQTARAAALVSTSLLVVPVVAYALTWVPWLVAYPRTDTGRTWCAAQPDDAACEPGVGERLAGLVRHHGEVLRFHRDLDAEHPYRAPATTWPVQARPVVFAYDACPADATTTPDGDPCLVPPGQAREVLGLGNPALWWSSLLLLPLAAGALRRRDGAAVVPLGFLATQFLPWFLVARPVFSFYAVPLVPFLALAVTVAILDLDRPGRHATTVTAAGGAAGAAAGVALLVGAALPAVATVALLAATTGAALGGVIDANRELRAPPATPRRRTAPGIAMTVALTAIVAFGYFSPVWYGVPVDRQVVERRWWFPDWV